MNSLTIKNLAKSYPTKTLFTDVSFTVCKGDRIAIVGANGAGKSTLLKILSGTETADSGKVITGRVSVAYIPQEFGGATSLTIWEYLDATKATSRIFEILKQFNVVTEEQIEYAYMHTLSEGQKRVVEIASVLSRSPMFLCIDEPENHLDIKTRQVLSELLKQYWGAVLFVSHDRYLINDIANKILSLQDNTAVLTTGKTYEQFRADERRKVSSALNRWKAEAKAVDRLEDAVRMMKVQTERSDAKAKTYQMKKRQLRERQEALGQKPALETRKPRLQTSTVRQKHGKLMLKTEHATIAYHADQPIIKDVSVDIRFGEKVILLGRNGSGKTSFLQCVMQRIEPTAGTIRLGNDLAIEYVDQNHVLDSSMSPLDHLYERGFTEEQARSMLAEFLFTQPEVTAPLKLLSGGQQQRFRFFLLFKANPEFIVLDEPTNNLDPTTWELLVELINDFTGAVLLVSHDRSFLEQIKTTRCFVLKNKTITESWAALDALLESLE